MPFKDTQSITALIAARMNSSRFPGKTLSDLHGLPMLERQIERISKSSYVTDIVVATTELPADQEIEDWCKAHNVRCYRGSANDVLGRLSSAAQHFNMKTVVEVLGDNPLVHSDMIDAAVELYFEKKTDYVATLTDEYPKATDDLKKFPIGVRVQVFPIATLVRCSEMAKDNSHREHATSYIAENPDLFSTVFVEAVGKFSDCNRPELTFAVNLPKNLELIRLSYNKLYDLNSNFTVQDAISLFDSLPSLKPLMGN
jgi:spore coat polysaccharide biosynthesis protein SpsF